MTLMRALWIVAYATVLFVAGYAALCWTFIQLAGMQP